MKLFLLFLLLITIGIANAEPLLVKEGTLNTNEQELGMIKETIKGANPFIGILIMFVINVVGLGLYGLKVML